MKKIITLVLIGMLLLSITGCSDDDNSPSTQEEVPLVTKPEDTPTDEAPTEIETETPEPGSELDSESEPTESDIGASVDIAEIIGRNFDEHRHLFGNVIGWLGGPGVSNILYSFDLGITLVMINNEYALHGWIYTFYVQFREPENRGVRSFADDEDFLGYEKSQRFHFNGIGHESTQADVEAAFPPEHFNRAYVRELSLFGDWISTADGRIPGGDIGIDLLEPYGFGWLIGRLDAVIFWNDYFAIVFEFAVDDDRVIDMLVFSCRRD